MNRMCHWILPQPAVARCSWRAWLAACLISLAPFLQAQETTNQWILVDDFEGSIQGWKFVDGDELPKAKGMIQLDPNVPHAGTNALRVDADFSVSGAYVGAWKNMESTPLPDFTEMRLWVKARNLSTVGIRLIDTTGQSHQKAGALVFSDIEEWKEVVFKVSDLIGGEHWGGANDGKWHGPAKGFGFDIGRNSLTDPDDKKGCLWLDDIRIVAAPVGQQTILPCVPWPASCRPGVGMRITYRWEATPMARDFSVLVRFVGADGKTAFQNDHVPPVSTRDWSGLVEYTNTLLIPKTMPEGEYRIMAGLYDPKQVATGGDRPLLKLGAGVVSAGADGTVAEIGRLNISTNAMFPTAVVPTLDLKGYRLTFNEDFESGLSVSPWGPGTRWIAHTPYRADFGEAKFANPEKDFPFVVTNGILRIEARRFTNFGNIGKLWRSGLLSSVDPKGAGFAQRFGYFEMRAKFPEGPGTWPEFWLVGVEGLRHPKENRGKPLVEIDVVEQYGINPYILYTTIHLWGTNNAHWSLREPSFVVGMTDDFHNYGVKVEDDFTTFYYDGVELRRQKTLEEAKTPLYMVVDLALGGGQSLEKTPSPSHLYIEHIRVYSKDQGPFQ